MTSRRVRMLLKKRQSHVRDAFPILPPFGRELVWQVRLGRPEQNENGG